MINRRASSSLSGTGDVFTALHADLTVGLISTPTDLLAVCTHDEAVCDVLGRNRADFDFIPVVDENARFVGMFNASNQRGRSTPGTIWGCTARTMSVDSERRA